MTERLRGLVAAVHTPFHADFSLNLAVVEKQAEHLLAHKVTGAFVGGTTGESSSLTVEERLALAGRWSEVVRGTPLKLIVHVGGNCLADARTLARQAESIEAWGISALAPCYFKPATIGDLVTSMAAIAGCAPTLPFYYYEIPSLTAINLSPSAFLEAASEEIPNLSGIKFTSNNLMEYQLCRDQDEGRFDAVFGFDEMLLAALALGAQAAVGSTYNFAAPLYHRLIKAFEEGDLATARAEQLRSVRLVQQLVRLGFMASAKATMQGLGVDVGPPRLPHRALSAAEARQLREELDKGLNGLSAAFRF